MIQNHTARLAPQEGKATMGVSFEELWRQFEERLSCGKLELKRLELLGEMKQMEMDAKRKELVGGASGDERLASAT